MGSDGSNRILTGFYLLGKARTACTLQTHDFKGFRPDFNQMILTGLEPDFNQIPWNLFKSA